jgi:hypothetical protein
MSLERRRSALDRDLRQARYILALTEAKNTNVQAVAPTAHITSPTEVNRFPRRTSRLLSCL